MAWRGRRPGVVAAARRAPTRRGTFVARWRLRPGGLLSGILLVGGLGSLGFMVLAVPWWVPPLFRAVHGPGSLLGVLFVAVLSLGLPAVVALLAGIRPGNAALRRRVLAMDDEGVWIYESARWRSAPRLVPWPDAGPIRLLTRDIDDGDPGDTGPGPALVPWDHLVFGDPPQAAVHLLWLTATAEDIVEQARLHRPDLTVLDQRRPPERGLGGRVLRRRRRTR